MYFPYHTQKAYDIPLMCARDSIILFHNSWFSVSLNEETDGELYSTQSILTTLFIM